MGCQCVCGVKKRDGWVCRCDWNGWFLCWKQDENDLRHIPIQVPVKEIPDKDGKYLVRVFEDGDDHETESEFSLTKKNWGEPTNDAISNWETEYQDGWMGYRGVYAWKEKTPHTNEGPPNQG